MIRPLAIVSIVLTLGLGGLGMINDVPAQDTPMPPASEPPPVPKGVEVLARGPVHEAFATPTTDPAPTIKIAKEPPKPIDELPPEEKPEGNVIWIGGYWAYDEDRSDFLWVSGTWRTPPPNKQWVPGYWKTLGDQWQWVAGFWTEAPKQDAPAQEVTYLPEPPAPPSVADPGQAPASNTFWVPGYWVWSEGRYRWREGYWARVQPNYVWVAAHYQWTPAGYVFVPGYWDVAVARRGVLYAPVYVNSGVVGVSFVYTPTYAVPDTVVVDALFVRPAYCHYYFGDYYEVRYREWGFTSCVVYSRSHYDSVIVYETYVHREDPTWLSIQIDLSSRRRVNPDLRPASTSITNVTYNNVVVQNSYTTINNSSTTINNSTTINKTNTTFLMPAQKLSAAQGVRTVKLDTANRLEAKQQARQIQQVAMKRTSVERPAPGGKITQPTKAALAIPQVKPVGPLPKSTMAATPSATSGAKSGFSPATNSSQTKSTANATTPTTRTTPNSVNSSNGIRQTGGTSVPSSGNARPTTGVRAPDGKAYGPGNSQGSGQPGRASGSSTTSPSSSGRPMSTPSSKSPPPKSDSDKDKKKSGQQDR